MIQFLTQFAAETESSAEGLGALGINLQSFIFQLITFLIVLWILRKFVYKRLVDTLENRRQAVLDSLKDAKATAEKLEETQEQAKKMLTQAQKEAADIVETARRESANLIEQAEIKASKKAEHLVENAKQQLDQEVQKARETLKKDTLELVARATETVLEQKVDLKTDKALIESAIVKAKR